MTVKKPLRMMVNQGTGMKRHFLMTATSLLAISRCSMRTQTETSAFMESCPLEYSCAINMAAKRSVFTILIWLVPSTK